MITLALAGLFALILLVAGTAQNEGCLPWKTPVTVGGAGVEPTEPWVARPHEF